MIGHTILEQLGGSRFVVMTGAKKLTAIENGLAFRLPSRFAVDGINHVEIILNYKDLYDIRYGKVWGLKYKVIQESLDVYADMLQKDFTLITGLDTRL